MTLDADTCYRAAVARDARFGRPPSALRRKEGSGAEPGALVLRLDFRPPLDWDSMLDFLACRATLGVEAVRGGAYRRTVRLGARTGWVAVTRHRQRASLSAEVSPSPLRPPLAGARPRTPGRGVRSVRRSPSPWLEHRQFPEHPK